jgi:sugar phosphate isomerase/epimerase
MKTVTRREFATGLAGAAAALAVGRRALAGDAGKVEPSIFGGIEVGVQSFTYRAFSVDRMIESMRSVGLSNVELWTGHLDPAKHTEADFKTVRGKLDAAGIRVSAYCVNFKPDAAADLLDKAFKGAGLLGTSLMTTSTEKSIVPKLDDWAQRYNVTIGIHNHWFGDAWFKGDRSQNFETPADFMGALEGRSKHLAINLDIGHFSAAGQDPVAFFKEHHERIMSLHVKDRDKDATHSNRKFGQGATPIVEVLKLAQQLKFKYAANIEWEEDEQEPTPGVKDSFEYMKRALTA